MKRIIYIALFLIPFLVSGQLYKNESVGIFIITEDDIPVSPIIPNPPSPSSDTAYSESLYADWIWGTDFEENTLGAFTWDSAEMYLDATANGVYAYSDGMGVSPEEQNFHIVDMATATNNSEPTSKVLQIFHKQGAKGINNGSSGGGGRVDMDLRPLGAYELYIGFWAYFDGFNTTTALEVKIPHPNSLDDRSRQTMIIRNKGDKNLKHYHSWIDYYYYGAGPYVKDPDNLANDYEVPERERVHIGYQIYDGSGSGGDDFIAVFINGVCASVMDYWDGSGIEWMDGHQEITGFEITFFETNYADKDHYFWMDGLCLYTPKAGGVLTPGAKPTVGDVNRYWRYMSATGKKIE